MYCIVFKDIREFKLNVKDYYFKNFLFFLVEMIFNDICKFWWWVLKLVNYGIFYIVVVYIWSVKDFIILVFCIRIFLCIYYDNVL